MAILIVGPTGQQFAKLSSAVVAAHDGDTIRVQAGTYTNDFSTITNSLTIQGVPNANGTLAHFHATVAPPNGKAILTVNGNITLDHIELSGAKVADNNGAGIRYEGGNLTVDHSYIHDNQDGILAN